jgi:hypothetical protein
LNEADVSAALAAAAGPPVRRREPLPSRRLDPPAGRLSRASLVLDLACVPLPARTRALLTGETGGFGPVDAAIVKWARARVGSLVRTLLSGDVRVVSYRPDAAALTGLGPGLTPTGDDLLVGLAAMARRLVGGGLLEARAAVAFATSLAGLAGADTTPAARKLLTQAASGSFPFVLADFVEAIGNPSARPEHLREITDRLTSTGAHSGADLLAGAVALVNGVIEQEIG